MLKGEFKLGWVFERRGLVCFLEQRNLGDLGIDDLISRERPRISGTRRARGMWEADGIRTRPIKCEHTVKHYCFIDIDTGGPKTIPTTLRLKASSGREGLESLPYLTKPSGEAL